MSSQLFVSAVLLAAGQSTRMGDGGPRKPFLRLLDKSLLELALEAFAQAPSVSEVVLVCHPEDLEVARLQGTASSAGHLISAAVPGGAERTDSVRLGVAACAPEAGVILVHDVARPFVRAERIEQVAQVAADRGAALLAVPMADTVKTSRDGEEVSGTLDRSLLWSAQTPQGFDAGRLREILARARTDGFKATDDAALFERYAGSVVLVKGDRDNIKITTPEDVSLGEAILRTRAEVRR